MTNFLDFDLYPFDMLVSREGIGPEGRRPDSPFPDDFKEEA